MGDDALQEIYCLFSVENNYDQPDYNLVGFLTELPTEERIAVAIGRWLGKPKLTEVLRPAAREIIEMYETGGCATRVENFDFRLERITEGDVLE